MSKLTDKQILFCKEYLIDLNATQAAIRAKYSKHTANEQGAQNLAKLSIQQYIGELTKERNERVELKADDVLRELKNFAYSDITETLMLTADELKDLPPEVRRLITKFKRNTRTYVVGEETHTEETIELWFIDKVKVFDMLNKHIGFYEADNNQDINLNITRKIIGGDKS